MSQLKLKPKDIVAIFVVVGILSLIALKANHSLDSILALIVGYYFAHRSDKVDSGL